MRRDGPLCGLNMYVNMYVNIYVNMYVNMYTLIFRRDIIWLCIRECSALVKTMDAILVDWLRRDIRDILIGYTLYL